MSFAKRIVKIFFAAIMGAALIQIYTHFTIEKSLSLKSRYSRVLFIKNICVSFGNGNSLIMQHLCKGKERENVLAKRIKQLDIINENKRHKDIKPIDIDITRFQRFLLKRQSAQQRISPTIEKTTTLTRRSTIDFKVSASGIRKRPQQCNVHKLDPFHRQVLPYVSYDYKQKCTLQWVKSRVEKGVLKVDLKNVKRVRLNYIKRVDDEENLLDSLVVYESLKQQEGKSKYVCRFLGGSRAHDVKILVEKEMQIKISPAKQMC